MVWACRRSEDLAGEDFLEIGVEVERFGAVAGECATFVDDALVQGGSEKSAEVVEVHFALLVGNAGVARSGAGQRGGVPGAGTCSAPVATVGFMLQCSKLGFLMLR